MNPKKELLWSLGVAVEDFRVWGVCRGLGFIGLGAQDVSCSWFRSSVDENLPLKGLRSSENRVGTSASKSC